MASDKQIRTALARARQAIELRPSIACGTMKSSTRLERGLRCIYSNGDWKLEIDEPEAVGGDGSAPSPGVYGMAAISGCVAMSIKNLAVMAGIAVAAIDVGVEADYDDHGMFGLKPIPPAGFTGFRLDIAVDSEAPQEQIREIVTRALETSSWHSVFARRQKIEPRITIGRVTWTTEE